MNILNKINRNDVSKFIACLVGIIIFALSVNLFTIQFNLINGGMVGFAIIFAKFIPLTVGTILIIINTVLILFTYKMMGKTVALKATIGYILASIFIDYFDYLMGQSQIFTTFNNITFLQQIFLTVFASVTGSIGIALVIKSTFSLGNYSTLFFLLKKKINISAPLLFFLCDLILAFLALFTLGVSFAVLILINSIAFSIFLEIYLRFISSILAKTVSITSSAEEPLINAPAP